MSDEQDKTHVKRDGETILLLGIFLLVLSAPVILGTLFAGETVPRVVCLISGLILTGIGCGFVIRGTKLLRSLH